MRLSMPIGETGGAFGSQRIRYEPNKPERFYCLVFLPGLRRFNHPFWKPIGLNGQSVSISASYTISKRLSLRSDAIDVQMEPREEAEMRTLEHWARAELPHPGKGPVPNDLGFNFQSGLARAQTAELASKLQEGEFHDLLQITLQMMDIYATPAYSRDAKNRGLVEWLKKLPDIKRQCLIIEVRDVAEGYQLTSTAEAVKQLIDWK